MSVSPLSDVFLKAAKDLFPSDFLSSDPVDLEAYGKDWTKVFPARPAAVAFPRSTEEVARLLKLCFTHKISVVPSGGRTGLSGGAVAAHGELVVSLVRMNRLYPVDTLAQTVRVEAGAVTQAVHEHCAKVGLFWPIDFASKGSSQVGGNISTNAGGVRVIRYGLTRNWVLGLTVVTATGEVLELNGALEKNQTGLDLRQLFIGSEGTLGIVTGATLKLTPAPKETDVMFFSVDDFPGVLSLFQSARKGNFVINAFEMLSNECLSAVCAHRGLNAPFAVKASYYVLIEIERPQSENGKLELEKWLDSAFTAGLVCDGVIAQSSVEARNLWELREGISESIMAVSMVHKHDIALPISRLAGFVGEFLTKLDQYYQGLELFLFGHIGDGNMHINIRKPVDWTKESFLEECAGIDRSIFELVQAHEGSVSAEHGIGLLKKNALSYSRTAHEIQVMKAVKAALDPAGILNPGKIV